MNNNQFNHKVMNYDNLKIPVPGGYESPRSEVIRIDASRQLMDASFSIPGVEEENLGWE